MPDVRFHEQAADERGAQGTGTTGMSRAVCATCGWKGKWRLTRGGWSHRDFYHHQAKVYKADMDALWEAGLDA